MTFFFFFFLAFRRACCTSGDFAASGLSKRRPAGTGEESGLGAGDSGLEEVRFRFDFEGTKVVLS